MQTAKQKNGQFYTTRCAYILDGLALPPPDIRCLMEPFAGQGDLLEWVRSVGYGGPIESYDIDPKRNDIVQRDTLLDPPDYTNAWVLTNPPYLARNKSSSKTVYDNYGSNDLYKCFLLSISIPAVCRGGVCIVPAGFFFSPRDIDTRCRDYFMRSYRITGVRYFEEAVFDDTSTTVVAIAFEKSEALLTEQTVQWTFLPLNIQREFHTSASTGWIVGGELYTLPVPACISVRRTVVGQPLKPGEQQTHMTLRAVDSGTTTGRISLDYKSGYIYPAKECSRSYATIRITGLTLSDDDQESLCREFGEFLEEKRHQLSSLFLPQFRESKEYARKRIPFELAYRIILTLLLRRTPA